ncbi:MAG: hypothetical protein SOX77_03140 [Candidatus Borkfalkiaceae bacterium]|nr:hypothetical protein [Christensenellaceae bacterium]
MRSAEIVDGIVLLRLFKNFVGGGAGRSAFRLEYNNKKAPCVTEGWLTSESEVKTEEFYIFLCRNIRLFFIFFVVYFEHISVIATLVAVIAA